MEHSKVVAAARKDLREKHPDDAEYRRAFAAWRKEHPMPRGTVSTVVDHIDHIAKVAGIDHVGIGSDFDGITAWPVGLEDVASYPRITEELLKRGCSETDIRKILGGNALRAFRRAGEVAKELQKTTKPEVDQPKDVPRDWSPDPGSGRGLPGQLDRPFAMEEEPVGVLGERLPAEVLEDPRGLRPGRPSGLRLEGLVGQQERHLRPLVLAVLLAEGLLLGIPLKEGGHGRVDGDGDDHPVDDLIAFPLEGSAEDGRRRMAWPRAGLWRRPSGSG